MDKVLIENYMVQIKEQQNSTLKRKLHNVNMRLYNNNEEYKDVVRTIINFLSRILYMRFENYPPLKGISGANLGIPFNIIIVKINNIPKQMINPEIIKRFGKNIEVTSNCGSLLLSEDITILRSEIIEIVYYDLNGDKKTEKFSGNNGFTIQHEIEHNLGITLLNARKEESKLC